MAVINIVIWFWATVINWNTRQDVSAQIILSGVYVFVCAYRSFFPRIDLERYCLIDSPLSSIVLGRSLATIAEICFSMQCALLIHDLGVALDSVLISRVAFSIVPIIIMAQLACWYATLTLNHFWHAVEELLWIVMIFLSATCFTYAIFVVDGWQRLLMLIGISTCVAALYIMLFIDVPMYFSRTRKALKKGTKYMAVGAGVQDAMNRRITTSKWKVWKKEVVWISSYFTVGVWLSISMIFIRF